MYLNKVNNLLLYELKKKINNKNLKRLQRQNYVNKFWKCLSHEYISELFKLNLK